MDSAVGQKCITALDVYLSYSAGQETVDRELRYRETRPFSWKFILCLILEHLHQSRDQPKNILHIGTELSICLSSNTALNLLLLAVSSPCRFSSFKMNKMQRFTWCFQLHNMILLNTGANWLGFFILHFLTASCVLQQFSALGKREITDVCR